MKENRKILVIDDAPLFCNVIDRILVKRGLKSVIAFDGNVARKIITNEGKAFAIIIVDLLLPYGPTGWELLDIIQNNPDTSKTPVIVITGVHISLNEKRKLKKKSNLVLYKQEFNVDFFGKVLDKLLG